MNSLLDPTKIDPSKIPDSQWEFEGYTPDGLAATYIHWHDKENGVFFRKKVNLVEEDILRLNKEELDDSQTKRFGDGRVVARVPMNVFYRDFASRLKEGDSDFTKWWLNNENNRPYRNFRGKF